MQSTKFSLNWRDALQGLIMAVGTPVFYLLQELIPSYHLPVLVQAAISATITYLLKNFFRDDTQVAKKIADENGQKIVPKSSTVVPVLLAMICFSFCGVANAQKSFFAKSPHFEKPSVSKVKSLLAIPGTKVNLLDSTYWAPRPIITFATSYPSGKVMAGTGISIQNNTYTYPTALKEGSTYCNYSVNFLVFAGGTIPPERPTDIISEGIMLGFLNNHIGAGVSHTRYKVDPVLASTEKKSRFELIVSYSVNLNN